MSTISCFFDPQKLLVMSCIYCFALPAISKPITFERVIIDEDGIGHREVGDMDIIGLRNHNRAPIEMWRNTIND